MAARRPSRRRTADDVAIWRYVTYPAYLELLRTRSLHFTRIDRLDRDDPYEGRFLLPDEWAEIARRSRRDALEPARAQFAVSCWSAAEGERTSLWERYASPFGVALKTTLARFRKALRRHGGVVHVGPVTYADDPALVREGGLDIRRWMLRKRPAFEDEQELRAVVWSLAARKGADDPALPPRGVDLPVDVGTLLAEVWVGPPWEPWFYEQVKDVSRRFGLLAGRVHRSTLMDPPLVPSSIEGPLDGRPPERRGRAPRARLAGRRRRPR